MLKIGLTGGIGSGKTTVAKIIQALGFPVYISDARASFLMNQDDSIRQRLTSSFGKEIYKPEGVLNKPRLASIIFNHKEAILKVNRIVHPVVLHDFEQWCVKQHTPLLFFESAILFEAALTHHFDRLITVTANLETRIDRVIHRDHTPREKVIERINNQIADTVKLDHSDYVIYNNDGDMILQQILNIIKELQESIENEPKS